MVYLVHEIYDYSIDEMYMDYKIHLNHVKLTNRTLSFGTANSVGVLTLSKKLFVGLTGEENYHQLIDTILHELAHLSAGIYAEHGPKWKKACIALGAIPEATSLMTKEMKKTSYKYDLYMITSCGERVKFKSTRTKHKKYTNARPGRYTLKSGKKVERFEYAPFQG